MSPERSELLDREPAGLTMREMLLRLDARLEKFEERTRRIEDEQLTARVERRTIMALFGSLRSTILVAAAVGPIIAGVIVIVAQRPVGP